jgi:hypothetical protein
MYSFTDTFRWHSFTLTVTVKTVKPRNKKEVLDRKAKRRLHRMFPEVPAPGTV